MASAQTDWTWQALIQSLQNDIEHLREHVDEGKKEAAEHRRQIDGLIDQLREVKAHLEPILSERQAAQKARREMLWGWAGKGGWLLLFGLLMAVWHYISSHINFKVVP